MLEHSGVRPGPPLYLSHSLAELPSVMALNSISTQITPKCLSVSNLSLELQNWVSNCPLYTWMDNRHLKSNSVEPELLIPPSPPHSQTIQRPLSQPMAFVILLSSVTTQQIPSTYLHSISRFWPMLVQAALTLPWTRVTASKLALWLHHYSLCQHSSPGEVFLKKQNRSCDFSA